MQIEKVCKKYNVALKSAALQFPLLHPSHLSVIPGGQSAVEMESNMTAMTASIPNDLWVSLKSAGLMHPDAPTG